MNHCKNCGVWVERLTCPLCHREVADPTFTTEVKWYPVYQGIKHDKRNSFVSKPDHPYKHIHEKRSHEYGAIVSFDVGSRIGQ